MMKYLTEYRVYESKVETPQLEFKPQPKKKGAKTGIWNVIKSGVVVGQIRWSSRVRGYAFLPTGDISDEIREFISDLMKKRRAEK